MASSIPSSEKVAIIPAEYTVASFIVLARSPSECFIKYETVIGIIGKTHGVSSEIAPKVIASQIKDQRSVGGAVVFNALEYLTALGSVFTGASAAIIFFTSSKPPKVILT